MPAYQPQNPDYEKFVRRALDAQGFMALIGAEVVDVEPGLVTMAVDYRDEIGQQDGFVHGGVVGTLCDIAAAAAAGTLVAPGTGILTIEYKISFLAPAACARLVARGEVIRLGRTVTVCRAQAFAEGKGARRHVASAQVSLMTFSPKGT